MTKTKTAFVFPGQGAQFCGMGKELFDASPAARNVFERAEKLRKGTTEQCFLGSSEELSQTINTQPCIFTVSLAGAAAQNEQGVFPDAVAGFSVGELAALTYAGAFDFESGFLAVIERAKLMHQASKEQSGSMAAVLRLSVDKVEQLCREYGVYAVNYNCPSQTVVAGETQKMQDFMAAVAKNGGRAMPLNVSGAFHSPYMKAASDSFAGFLTGANLKTPRLPVYSNVTARPYTMSANDTLATITTLSVQIKSPVLWQKTIENMSKDGIKDFIEMPPGKVLSGLIAKII